MLNLPQFLRDNRFDPAYLPRLEDKLFLDGANMPRNVGRFIGLLFLSTIIATFGVFSGSDATVIGAMLVAPLMTPIMGTTAALVMGRPIRAWWSFFTVVCGVIGVVLLSWLLAAVFPIIVSFTTNPQITSRISPRLMDLIVALAAGAAGAFAISREDVADSMPGVAIAISLVPPLCTVGISLAHGEWAAAQGAFLLWLTNFLAILLAGGAMLTLLGVGAGISGQQRQMQKRIYTLVVGLTLLVAIPLTITGYQVTNGLREQIQAQRVVQEWASERDLEITEVQVQNNLIRVTMTGSDEVPQIELLAATLEQGLKRPVTVSLRFVPSQLTIFPQSADMQANE